eukprot:jgi/Bigna1/76791/fgenesh1_pg.43_\
MRYEFVVVYRVDMEEIEDDILCPDGGLIEEQRLVNMMNNINKNGDIISTTSSLKAVLKAEKGNGDEAMNRVVWCRNQHDMERKKRKWFGRRKEDGGMMFKGMPIQDMYTENRKARLRSMIKNRQKGIVVVLEHIGNYENAAAVIRSCDAFGVAEVWFVRSKNDGKNRLENALKSDTFQAISVGAVRWIQTRKEVYVRWIIFDSTKACFEELNALGYGKKMLYV